MFQHFVPRVAVFACTLILAAATCGCGTGSIASGPSVSAAPLPAIAIDATAVAQQQAALAALTVPEGADAVSFEQLRAMLAACLDGAARNPSVVPHEGRSGVADIAVSDDGSGSYVLNWTYRNTGDYNVDSEVNISDMTPLGVHLQKTSDAADWTAARFSDGDGNGEINVSDITPIGSNFFARVSGYNIYSSDSETGPWTLAGSVAFGDGSGLPPAYSFALPGPPAGYYTIAPFDATGTDAILSLTASPPPPGAEVQLGATVDVATASVDAAGGTLTGGAGTPLEGYSLEIPAGAFTAPVNVTLAYNEGTVTPAVGSQHGPLIEINTDFDGNIGFENPLKVTVPFAGGVDELAIPYYVNPQGYLELCNIVATDTLAGTMTFETWHASCFAVLRALAADPFAEHYDSKFVPDIHGFQDGAGDTTRIGAVAFAGWHYRTTRAPLYNRFNETVGRSWSGQGLMIQRAQYATKVQMDRAESSWQTDVISGRLQWTQIRNALQNSRGPVMLVGRDGNSTTTVLLAFAFVGNKLFCYDPKEPGATRELTYDTELERLMLHVNGKPVIVAEGSLAQREPFSNILADALAGFHGSPDATIDLGTLSSGDVILVPNLNLNGAVHSGENLVKSINVYRQGVEGSIDKNIGLDGVLSMSVPLDPGENWLMFRVFGLSIGGQIKEIGHNLSNKPLLVVGDFEPVAPGEPVFRLELTWDPSVGPQPGDLDLYVRELNHSSETVDEFNSVAGPYTTFWGSELKVEENKITYVVEDNDLRPDNFFGIWYRIHRKDDTGAESKYQPYLIKIWWGKDGPGQLTYDFPGQLNFGDGVMESPWVNPGASNAWSIYQTFGF